MEKVATTYFVRDFDLIEMRGFTLFITDEATIKIVDPSVLGFLQNLRGNCRSYVRQEILEQMATSHKLPRSRLIEFLRSEGGLLIEASDPAENPGCRSVRIYRDVLTDAADWLDYLSRDGVIDVCISHIDDIAAMPNSDHDGWLAAIFLQHYDPDPIRKLYASLNESGENAALTAYVIGDQFWIDGIYMKNMGLPSHFDHLEKWRRMYKKDQTSGWSDLVDLFAAHGVRFLNPYRPRKLEINIAAIHFLRRIVDFSGSSGRAMHLNDMLQAQRVDLRTGVCIGEIVSAWPTSRNRDFQL